MCRDTETVDGGGGVTPPNMAFRTFGNSNRSRTVTVPRVSLRCSRNSPKYNGYYGILIEHFKKKERER